jgi:hypothetical protein
MFANTKHTVMSVLNNSDVNQKFDQLQDDVNINFMNFAA